MPIFGNLHCFTMMERTIFALTLPRIEIKTFWNKILKAEILSFQDLLPGLKNIENRPRYMNFEKVELFGSTPKNQ